MDNRTAGPGLGGIQVVFQRYDINISTVMGGTGNCYGTCFGCHVGPLVVLSPRRPVICNIPYGRAVRIRADGAVFEHQAVKIA